MTSHQTLQASRVFLTAGFYREYLGFQELWRLEKDGLEMIWLHLKGQNLLIEPRSESDPAIKSIGFSLEGIENYYFNLKEKVRICTPLQVKPDNEWHFSYFDCEGNNITVSGSLSSDENPSQKEYHSMDSCSA